MSTVHYNADKPLNESIIKENAAIYSKEIISFELDSSDFYPRPAEGRRVLSSSKRLSVCLSVRPSVTHDYTVNFPTQRFRNLILDQ